MKLTPKVLLLDDETFFRRPFQQLLRKEELDVRIALSVGHLLKLADVDSYDASLIDVRLTEEGCEGLKAVRQLRKTDPDMYIEVITAYDEYESHALEIGADAVFIKPRGTECPEAARRIKRGILSKKLARLAEVTGIDLEEALDAKLFENGRSAWASVKASLMTDCFIKIDPFLVPVAEKHSLDRKTIDSLRIDLIEFFTKQLFGPELKCGYEADPTCIAPELANDVNFTEYRKHRETLRKKHLGQYVAFVDGHLVEVDSDMEGLLRKVRDKYGAKSAFVKKITAIERKVAFRRPKVARKR